MFFLLRVMFWIGLVLVLLPRDKAPDSGKGPQVSAGDAVLAATAAVSDVSQFCTRQPAACAVGGEAASVVGARAQAGARKVIEFLAERGEKSGAADKTEKSPVEKPTVADKMDASDKIPLPPEKPKKNIEKRGSMDRKSPDHTGSIDAPEEDPSMPHDTLTEDDLAIEWQGAAAPL
ncbi:MAG: DUF5330 domain-containing protein [Xanthobacteraceae bacterium]|nr:DUF5330 domain-containing protein [Xanthobacteraceae bacterium]